LSVAVFNLFLKALDENQKFYLTLDIESFSKDKFKLDDYIKNKDCSFIEKYAETLQKRLEETEIILNDLKNEPFDYAAKDSLYYYSENKEQYFKSEASRADYWSRNIRFKILKKISESQTDLEVVLKDFTALEADMKEQVIEQEICLMIEKKEKLKTEKSMYLNIISFFEIIT